MNLIEGIHQECSRVREEILPRYDELGHIGMVGGLMLRRAITEGEASIASGDIVRMVRAYHDLKDLKDCET